MRPSVATVLTHRGWEAELVGLARRSGGARIVGRAYDPEDLERMGPIDAVVVGSETSWLSAATIRRWRARGWRVIGVHPPTDSPGRRLLEEGGADFVAPDSTPADHLLRVLAWLPPLPPGSPGATVIAVTGARGAPGRTTVAIAMAHSSGSGALLLDADPLPNVGPTLGIGPGPAMADVSEVIRVGGQAPITRTSRGLAVLTPEPGGDPLAGALLREVALSMRASFDTLVIDTGPPGPDLPRMLGMAERTLLVVDGTPQGLIRAAHLTKEWQAATPEVVLNRARGDVEQLVRSCRLALGLEPAVILPRFGGDPAIAAVPFLAAPRAPVEEPYSVAAT